MGADVDGYHSETHTVYQYHSCFIHGHSKCYTANMYNSFMVYEAWHYKKTAQYDPASKTGGLFTLYINSFLGRKQCKSRWPDWVQSDEDKEKYLTDYFEKEGITLDPEQIEVNQGMGTVAKLMLNSL